MQETDGPDAWTIAGWLSATITIAGCAHLLPLWLPLELRDPAAVMSTAAQAADAYPTLLVGLYLWMATCAARARWLRLAVLGGVLTVLTIVVLGSGLVYGAAAVSLLHDLAGADQAVRAQVHLLFLRTVWMHAVVGVAALIGGIVAVELARHYRQRKRI